MIARSGRVTRPGWPLAGLAPRLLASIVEGTSDAVIAASLEGEILTWNAAAERIFGWARHEIQGRSLACLYPEDRAAERAWVLERILAGERVEQLETVRVARDGRAIPVSVTVSPLRDDEGDVYGTSSIVRDVTDHRHRDQLLRLLAEASGVLARIVDYDEARAVVPGLPVPVLADLCLVDLLEPSGQLTALPAAHSGLDPQSLAVAESLLRTSWESLNMASRSMRSGSVSVQARIDPSLEAPLQEVGLRCVLSIPLVVQSRTLGVATLARSRARCCFGAEDVRTAETLVTRMALALDHAFLYREKERLSQTLQESILPSRLPAIPGMEVAAWYTPAVAGLLVGGDFYDVLRVGDGWALFLGDVTGKGAAAAARTSFARYTLAAACVHRRRPSRILAALNDAVWHRGPHGLFATVAMARLRPGPASTHLTLSLAGHPHPFILRASGEVERVGTSGFIIGLQEDAAFFDCELDMHAGDTLLLYTDGLTDARSYARGEFGEERIVSILGEGPGVSATEVIGRLRAALEAFEWLRDDIALMALHCTG